MSIRQCPRCGYQLLPGEGECPKCKGAPATTASAAAGPAPTSGLAIAALVVGILALCGGLLALPGLVLGIAALVQVNRSGGRGAGRGMAWSAIGLSVFALVLMPIWLAITFPVFMRAREAARIATCVENVKQLTVGILTYAQQHGEKLPPADTWCDDIVSNVKDRSVFRCPNVPEAQSGYAFNRALTDKSLSDIADPQRTVLIYESDMGWNGAGGPETMVERHIFGPGKGTVVGFADGHVQQVTSKQLPGLVWQPGGPPAPMR